MAVTQNTYTGNGSTTNYSFTFPYLETTDIKVSLNGVDTTAYTLANATTVSFNTAPANGAAIRIYRDTDDSTLAATFYPGSAIRATDLNDNFTQNLYSTQEVKARYLDRQSGEMDAAYVPTISTDVVTKGYMETNYGVIDEVGFTRWRQVATAGQTIFSGAGSYGNNLSFVPNREQVYLNGALQQINADYTTNTAGTTITFGTALTVGDVVDVVCINNLVQNSTTSSDDLSFVQSGTGAVTRSIGSKLRDVVSVKDFGAVGDGVTDCTQYIQAAINAASEGNSTVYIPDGVYRITSGLIIPDDGITIEGSGYGRSLSANENTGTRIIADFSTGWVITCLQACFTLRDIEIYGSDSVRWASQGSVDGTKGAIYIRGGVTSLLERVLVYQEPGIGIYMSHECPSSKLTQVTVEYCKGHAYYVDDGALDSSSGYTPCGIITFDTCRASRVDCCALVAGDITDESGTGLSAYRLKLINCEFLFCGGNTTLSNLADYVIQFNSDNCSWEGGAVSSPNNQAGGNSYTAGTLASSGDSAALVSGIYVNGRNNHLLNSRYIRTRAPAVKVAANATNTVIDGVEARHTDGTDYDSAISFDSGANGITVSNVGSSQVADPTNATLSLVSTSIQPVSLNTSEALYLFCNGDGLLLDTANNTLSYYDGTIQVHRFATDGTHRSLGAVRPMANNTASLGVAGARWTEVFAVNGTINTSDARLKEQIRELSDAERRVAVKVKGLVKAFKFKHSTSSKGADAARTHIGVIAQEVITAFKSEGLDPFNYGIVCYDTWDQELADDGTVAIEAGDIYSIRYEELLAFIVAAL